MGNIRSVEQALKYIGAEYIVTSDKKEILRERINNSKHPLTIDGYNSNIYLENRNSY